MKKIFAVIFTGMFIFANTEAMAFDLYSKTIRDNSFMSIEQASDKCGGKNISPDLEWGKAPEGAKSLALIVHDPDAPVEHGWYHWIVVDIPVTAIGIKKGAKFASPAREITTSWGAPGYDGPCPPPGHGKHRYNFTVYALNTEEIELSPDMKPYEVEEAVKSHSLGEITLTGIYERK
ncbi:MAG: YbhB/YbcL family Raf kinase inhibitor-like protein [Endomicrobia bacterium]|nr:YbhB/YbcL family Raf kinase inhibitor-like protein [Endomicrobiia bacterium]MCL2506159.1 YbhB/YbcL family Raf kinase inhibitor-like protein [Endomicrobiia bacterium]